MYFEIMTNITDVEIIAVNTSIRELTLLREHYGDGRWRKLKGTALVRLVDGQVRKAEIHWYEAQGIGQKKFKIKRFLD